MTDENAKQLLKGLKLLPPFPATVTKLLKLTEDPDSDMHEIARAVSNDVMLTARILRVANSSFFGLSHKITTVSQAITILGIQSVRNLALGVSICSHFKELPKPFSLDDIWRHSLAVATAARLIAIRLKLGDPEELFVAGLMHDIGRLMLMRHYSEHYLSLLNEYESSGKPLVQIERESLGIDHAALGEKLCHHWNIPDKLATLVGNHHAPIGKINTGDEVQMSCIIMKIANNIAKISQLGYSGDSHVEVDYLKAVEQRMISKEKLRQVMLILPDKIKNVEVFLELVSEEKEEKPEEEVKPPAIALIMQNDCDREIIAMSLINMGFALRELEQACGDDSELKAVVADDSLSETVRKELVARDVLVLNFADWQQEYGVADPAIYSIPKLKSWLDNNLGMIR